jgi:hypothetical protein
LECDCEDCTECGKVDEDGEGEGSTNGTDNQNTDNNGDNTNTGNTDGDDAGDECGEDCDCDECDETQGRELPRWALALSIVGGVVVVLAIVSFIAGLVRKVSGGGRRRR